MYDRRIKLNKTSNTSLPLVVLFDNRSSAHSLRPRRPFFSWYLSEQITHYSVCKVKEY